MHVAAISRDGTRILGVGSDGIAFYDRGAWRVCSIPSRVSARSLGCAAVLDDGSIVVGGEAAFAGRLEPNGDFSEWKSTAEWNDVHLKGVEVTDEGWVTFVGQQGKQNGIIAWLRRDALTIATAPYPIHAIATLADGRHQLACGRHGALVSSGWSSANARCFDADLMSITAFGEGALVVGSGGHAFQASDKLETSLEAVDTLSTLTVVTTSDAGTPWAGSSRGRILRRRALDGRWARMSPDFEEEPSLLALWASEERIRAVGSDGSLVLGWRRTAP
jgi:hypothetical protein